MATTIWEEISKIKNPRRRIYFMWKNGIENIRIDYGELTQDEFIEKCNKLHTNEITNVDFFLGHMKRWESSAEYKRLLFLLQEDRFATDLLKLYESVKEKAIKDTDSQAIKNMVMLQKEIKNYRKSIDKFQEQQEETDEDDGLRVNI